MKDFLDLLAAEDLSRIAEELLAAADKPTVIDVAKFSEKGGLTPEMISYFSNFYNIQFMDSRGEV